MREVEARVGAPVAVLVAARELEPGRELKRGDVAIREVPERFAPSDSLATAEEVVGAVAAAPLARGAYVTAASLGGGGGGATGAASGLRKGERAVEVAVTGGAEPGARVDVLVSTEAGEGGSGRSFLALEDVEVLDVASGAPDAQAPEGDRPAASATATLRVTLRQAVYLTAAQNFAREVRLLPRPAGDRSRARRAAVSAGGL
jgi:pilus assembly protein CpaB